MPLGKTPEEIMEAFDIKMAEIHCMGRFGGNIQVEENRQWFRQALKDLLDHAIAEMPKKPDPSHDEVFKYGIEKGIDDCIAVLNKLKESV